MKKLKGTVISIIIVIIILIAGVFGKDLGNLIFNKFETKQSSTSFDKPWFNNALYGVSIKTPSKLEEYNANIPEGYEEYISSTKAYYSEENGLFVGFNYIDANFEEYDVKLGLQSAIENVVYAMNGSNLHIEFQSINNKDNYVKCNGTFLVDDSHYATNGYCLYDGINKIVIVFCISEDIESLTNTQDSIINSIRVSF